MAIPLGANSGRRKIEPMRAGYKQQDDDEALDGRDGEADWMQDLIRQARETGSLTDGEEGKLLRQAAFGDGRSQERLVAAHLGTVIRLAQVREQRGLSVPDLVQEGSIGLVEAVRTFGDSGQSDFGTFAEQRIGAQMDSAIAAEAAAVRDAELLIAAATDYERTELLMRYELHRPPAEAELAEKLEWTVERTRYVAHVVTDARREHDNELLRFVDPEALVIEDEERAEFDS